MAGGGRSHDDLMLKQEAVRLVAHLPDDPEKARAILGYAMELMDDFYKAGKPVDRPGLAIVPDTGRQAD